MSPPAALRSLAALAAAGLILGARPAAGAEQRFRLDPDHSFVHFSVLHTGISSVHGRLPVRAGSATVDLEAGLATVQVDIDLAGVDTGVRRLDAILRGELFLDVARYPTARYSGRAVAFRDGMPWVFEGELALHGTTQPVRLEAERFTCRAVSILVLHRFVCGGDLQGTLQRSAFGLSQYLPLVDDAVHLSIPVEAIRQGP